VDARSAYDWPARYEVDHDVIREVVSYTATYFGQAVEGERIEARGMVERSPDGARRLILGSSREASQAYLRVI
jgi:predicted nucleotidyltransferase